MAALTGSLLMALPYLLLRLVDDFAEAPSALMGGALVGLLLAVVTLFALPAAARPLWLNLLFVAYFVGLEVYAAVKFVGAARRARGVTRRRMQAAAVGSLCLGLVIAVAGLQLLAPEQQALWIGLADALALGSGVAYFVGFAPPAWLRRAWQGPELRDFLSRPRGCRACPIRPASCASSRRARPPRWRAPGGHRAVGRRSGPAARRIRAAGVAWPADQPARRPGFRHAAAAYAAEVTRVDPANAELYAERGESPCWLRRSRPAGIAWACWSCTPRGRPCLPTPTWSWCGCWPTRPR